MLNPITQLFQIQPPYFLQGQPFNPPILFNSNRFLLDQDQYFEQQAFLQRQNLQAFLYSRQQQILQKHYYYQSSPLQKIESSPSSYGVKVETPIKFEQDSFLNKTQIASRPCKIEECTEDDESISQSVISKEGSEPSDSRDVIVEMLEFFITKFDKTNDKEIKGKRGQYAYNAPYLRLFDSLKEKYTSTRKSREDLMRFTLRKAMTYLRDNTRDKLGLTAKAASIELCKRYFEVDKDEVDEKLVAGVNLENDGELMTLLLPYKKNSRNKTANSRFIREIFASEAFCQDYAMYLEGLEGILEAENQKKIDKFVGFLEACVRENSFNKIKQFKRVPWLQVWLENTKTIAQELAETWKPSQEKATITDFKKLKNYNYK